jgi:hypothetical protein
MNLSVKIVIVHNRVLLDWGDETDSQQACVHGIKLRWECEECERIMHKIAEATI